MTQEDKELLLKDLCARLPYGVKVDVNFYYATKELSCDLLQDFISDEKSVRPYLRPMSSITEEERTNLRAYCGTQEGIIYDIGVTGKINSPAVIDFLHTNHFDYRGLIEMGLALEAPEGMYNKYVG